MSYSTSEIWWTITIIGIGTFLLRFSFLGIIGDRQMPPLVLRILRYTPVAVLPAMVAPLVVWPQATGGETDLARVAAALVTLGIGLWRRNLLLAIFAGAVTLYAGLYITGQF